MDSATFVLISHYSLSVDSWAIFNQGLIWKWGENSL